MDSEYCHQEEEVTILEKVLKMTNILLFRYYDATIEAITDNGDVSVVFDAYQNRSTTTISELRECKVRNEVFPSTSNK